MYASEKTQKPDVSQFNLIYFFFVGRRFSSKQINTIMQSIMV